MDVLVTGSTGFIGSALISALIGAGHRPIRAVRGRATPAGVDAVSWDPDAGTIDASALEDLGAVVHLAGAGIGDKKWTAQRKQLILESRTRGTRSLAQALATLDRPPPVLVSSSAVGYYGSHASDTVLTETSPPGDDFLAQVCVEWEAATAPAAEAGIRVVRMRTGIVLGRDGGVLGQLLLPFRLGLGGRLGSGEQWMSWITIDDAVAAILHVLQSDSVEGSVNFTAPAPVTNNEFTAALGRAVHRPTKIPTPLAPLRLRYGSELVEHLLLASQRALPEALEKSGFQFRHTTLDAALHAVLG